MDNEIQNLKTNEDNRKSKTCISQQHDYKNAKLCRSKDRKNPELKGDAGKHLKTHNICLNTAVGTSQRVSEKHKNSNLNQLFEKPFTPRLTPKNILTIEPQTSTYSDSIHHDKRTYNHITRTYIENIYKIQTVLNLNPRSTTAQEPNQDYLTQKLQATTDILYEEIKSPIQVRIIGISTIIQEVANNYLNENTIWSYYARDQLMIYPNSRELRKADMNEVQRWILSLLKPEERPKTRALKVGFILVDLLTRYCKLISHKYADHICSKCNGEGNIKTDVQLE
ncbi:hypothetical protein H5410_027870 [Solanum commersonii]|uniref:Uncharacterized protein n=1 Tax=Solanum commersonii TaxID=4109 RepID=A0A9J5Z122_SOLCO|nr:hypothetical protein H5410_027870 [Solanum commersonii]